MSTAAGQGAIPGALYDGDGTLLAGEGPEMTPELTDALPYKALVRDKPGWERVAVLEHGDRLWLLPDSFGTPPELPIPLLLELAAVVRRGRQGEPGWTRRGRLRIGAGRADAARRQWRARVGTVPARCWE